MQSICPYTTQCHVWKIGMMASNAELIRELYCCGDPRHCQRDLRKKREEVPVDGTQNRCLAL